MCVCVCVCVCVCDVQKDCCLSEISGLVFLGDLNLEAYIMYNVW